MQYAGGDVALPADEVEEADPSQVFETREEAEVPDVRLATAGEEDQAGLTPRAGTGVCKTPFAHIFGLTQYLLFLAGCVVTHFSYKTMHVTSEVSEEFVDAARATEVKYEEVLSTAALTYRFLVCVGGCTVTRLSLIHISSPRD